MTMPERKKGSKPAITPEEFQSNVTVRRAFEAALRVEPTQADVARVMKAMDAAEAD